MMKADMSQVYAGIASLVWCLDNVVESAHNI